MGNQSNHKKLMAKVVSKSNSNEWIKAKKEWDYSHDLTGVEGTCACGHELHNLYFIKNRYNYNEIIVGSSCVKKFNNENINRAVKAVEDREKLKRKQLKKYENLKEAQVKNNVPRSVRKEFLLSKYKKGIINEFEYNFYLSVWRYDELSVKQHNLKEKLNNRMLSK